MAMFTKHIQFESENKYVEPTYVVMYRGFKNEMHINIEGDDYHDGVTVPAENIVWLRDTLSKIINMEGLTKED